MMKSQPPSLNGLFLWHRSDKTEKYALLIISDINDPYFQGLLNKKFYQLNWFRHWMQQKWKEEKSKSRQRVTFVPSRNPKQWKDGGNGKLSHLRGLVDHSLVSCLTRSEDECIGYRSQNRGEKEEDGEHYGMPWRTLQHLEYFPKQGRWGFNWRRAGPFCNAHMAKGNHISIPHICHRHHRRCLCKKNCPV